MTQPDVTLTDYAIALECAVFCVLARGWPAIQVTLGRWWIAFFASVGLAAFVGGTMHGFFPDDASAGGTALWIATMLTLGVTSVAGWTIGSRLTLSPAAAKRTHRTAIALFVAYALVVFFVSRQFLVAIAMYLPATIFLLWAMIARHRKAPDRALAIGIAGLALTFVAAAIQQLKVAVHPVWFNHNALYHVVQFAALWMLFVGARRTVATTT